MALYHNTPDGAFHVGPEAECRKCRHFIARAKRKKMVQDGEIKPQALSKQYSKRVCDGCGKTIKLHSVTGLCITCLLEKRQQKDQQDAPQVTPQA